MPNVTLHWVFLVNIVANLMIIPGLTMALHLHSRCKVPILIMLPMLLYISCFGSLYHGGFAMAIKQQTTSENIITSDGLTAEEETIFRRFVEQMSESRDEQPWYEYGNAPNDDWSSDGQSTDAKFVLKAMHLAQSGLGVIDAIETRLRNIEEEKRQAMGLWAEQQMKTVLPYRIITTNHDLVLEITNHDCLNNTDVFVPSNRTPYDLGGYWHGRGDNVLIPFDCPLQYDFDRSEALKTLQQWRARTRSKRHATEENQLADGSHSDQEVISHEAFNRYKRAVDTQAKIAQVNLTLTSEVFDKTLLNILSSSYNSLVNNITTEIDAIFNNKPGYVGVNDFSFRPGSVITTFHIEITGADGISVVLYTIGNATIGGMLGPFVVNTSQTSVGQYADENGVYTNWGSWSPCTKTCGEGTQTRSRTCNSTAPLACAHWGAPIEILPCYLSYCSQDCSFIFNNESATSGSFSSPVGSNHQYPALADCVYQVIVDDNHTIVAYFTDFEVEIDKKCNYDYVAVYDDAVPYHTLGSNNELMRFCGNTTPPRAIPQYGYPINSSGSALTFYFKTDGDKQFRGFNLTWYKVLKFDRRDENVIPQSVATLSFVISPWSHRRNEMVPFGAATTCPNNLKHRGCFFLGDQVVISRMVGAFMNKRDRTDSDKMLSVTFEHVLHEDFFPSVYNARKTCVTWDHEISSPKHGAWTRRGCYTAFSNLTHTICKCDHSGVFVVLGESKPPTKQLKLKANSYFGVAVAILFTIMTIYSLTSKEERTTGELFHLYKTFVAALLLLIFIIGANVSAQKEACGFLAVCVYYLVLSQFTWMLLTVLWIQHLLKRYLTEKIKLKLVYFVLGWLIPLILAGVIGKVHVNNNGNEDNVCWTSITGAGTVWGYGAPIFVMLLISISILIYLLLPISRENYHYQNLRPRVIKEIVTMVSFLAAWMSAVSVTVNDSFKNQYFFCIFLIFQAVTNYILCFEKTEQFWKDEEIVTEIKTEQPSESIEKSQEIALEEKEPVNENANKEQTRMTVKTLKNLNIYKEDGVFVIEA